jgi:DNA polymerase-3 subunit gamma/tau
MAYEALARKWRPKTFDEIVGQGHVTRALSNAITSGKIHHAYLFSGTRGVGKTTFARILARALNCENGPTPTPCLACPSCVEVGAGTDVQEIDGASNTGIDDIRLLRENAAYAPSRLRYKVYIIDEVHMLSKQAFNGLLKTLEEPPPRVVFILATTEPNRIPETILSRVQRFDFRMLTDAEVRGRLAQMAAAEGIAVEEDALSLLARYAFGSMRDGQSLFEQAAVSGGGAVTASLVEGMLGLVGVEAAIDLVSDAVLDGAGAALSRFSSLLSRGADLKHLYLSVIDVLRDAAVLSFTGREALLFRHSPASLARMRDLVARRSREEWMFLLDIAFRSERDVLATEFPHLGFELLLLRLANAQGLLSVEALDASGDPPVAAGRAGKTETAGDAKAEAAAQKAPAPTFSRRAAPAGHAVPPAPGAGSKAQGAAKGGASKGDEKLWEAVRGILEGRRKTVLLGLLSQMRGEMRGDEFVVTCGHAIMLDRLKERDKWEPFLAAVEEAAGRPVPVRLAESAEKKSPEPDAGGGPPPAPGGGGAGGPPRPGPRGAPPQKKPPAPSPRGRPGRGPGAEGAGGTRGPRGPAHVRGLHARECATRPRGARFAGGSGRGGRAGRRTRGSGSGRGGGMTDFKDLMRQAQDMRDRFRRLQEELGARTVEGSAGGGMVTVVANGRQEILSVRVEREVVSPDDIGMLQDLVRAAVNDALARSRELAAAEMAKVTGGILPPGIL